MDGCIYVAKVRLCVKPTNCEKVGPMVEGLAMLTAISTSRTSVCRMVFGTS
jgi:hypothetical protein